MNNIDRSNTQMCIVVLNVPSPRRYVVSIALFVCGSLFVEYGERTNSGGVVVGVVV